MSGAAATKSEAITECRRNTGRYWINRDNGKENGGSFPAVFLSSVKGHNNQEAERNHCADGNKWMTFQHEREKRDVFITGCGIIVLDGLVSGDDHRKNDKYPHIIT